MSLPNFIFAGNSSTLLINSCNSSTTHTSGSYNRFRYRSDTSRDGECCVSCRPHCVRSSVATAGHELNDMLGLHFLLCCHCCSSMFEPSSRVAQRPRSTSCTRTRIRTHSRQNKRCALTYCPLSSPVSTPPTSPRIPGLRSSIP